MTIKQIIEKAIEGGWLSGGSYTSRNVCYKEKTKQIVIKYKDEEWDGTTKWSEPVDIYKALLNPAFWEAVGKVEGWESVPMYDIIYKAKQKQLHPHEQRMHQMIDHLIAEGSIESYIETL